MPIWQLPIHIFLLLWVTEYAILAYLAHSANAILLARDSIFELANRLGTGYALRAYNTVSILRTYSENRLREVGRERH